MSSPEPHRQLRRFYWLLAWITVTLTFVPVLRLRARNWRRVPRKGGVLIVANHTTFFDPVLVSWATRRRTHGVGTDQMLRVPVFGRMLPWLSVIAFAKGMKDKAAMVQIDQRALERWSCCFPRATARGPAACSRSRTAPAGWRSGWAVRCRSVG